MVTAEAFAGDAEVAAAAALATEVAVEASATEAAEEAVLVVHLEVQAVKETGDAQTQVVITTILHGEHRATDAKNQSLTMGVTEVHLTIPGEVHLSVTVAEEILEAAALEEVEAEATVVEEIALLVDLHETAALVTAGAVAPLEAPEVETAEDSEMTVADEVAVDLAAVAADPILAVAARMVAAGQRPINEHLNLSPFSFSLFRSYHLPNVHQISSLFLA